MLQQVVIDVFNALKFIMRHYFLRSKYIGVQSVKTFDITDKLKSLDPFIGSQQVEVGGTDKIDGHFIFIKESSDIGDAF